METLFTIISSYDLGLVGLLLLIIAGLLWLHYRTKYDDITKRLGSIEAYRENHAREHIELEKECRNRHEYTGIERRKK